MKLKEFQDRFQRAILKGDDAILADIPDGPHETKQKLLSIYHDAYALRLIEVIGNDHEYLQTLSRRRRFRRYGARLHRELSLATSQRALGRAPLAGIPAIDQAL